MVNIPLLFNSLISSKFLSKVIKLTHTNQNTSLQNDSGDVFDMHLSIQDGRDSMDVYAEVSELISACIHLYLFYFRHERLVAKY